MLRNETIDGFSNLTNITDNLQKEFNNVTKKFATNRNHFQNFKAKIIKYS